MATHSAVDGHEIVSACVPSGRLTGDQCVASPSGLVDTNTWKPVEVGPGPPSAATQSAAEGHDTEVKPFALPSSTFCAVIVHVAAMPSAGSVDVTTSPEASTATQNTGDGQEIALKPALPLV